MRFITLSKKEMESKYFTITENHLLISINNPNEETHIHNNRYCHGILKINFLDIEDIDTNEVYFDRDIARQILDFVDKNCAKVTTIVVHCGVGVSRSVAVASALSKIINHSDDNIFSYGIPNMLVYTTILDEYFSNKNLDTDWHNIWYLRNFSLRNLLSTVVYKISEYKQRKRKEK